MKKLIELLNEYDNPVDEDERVYSEYSGNFLRGEREDMERMSPEKLCGKKFGFIKWLVDNDKIDFSREGEYCIKSIEEFDGLLRDDVDGLIMLLAIQDSPLTFLISILK